MYLMYSWNLLVNRLPIIIEPTTTPTPVMTELLCPDVFSLTEEGCFFVEMTLMTGRTLMELKLCVKDMVVMFLMM